MRERRRLRLAERQLMLARIARREAMGALAGALDEEAKSATLAERSAALAREYGGRSAVVRGADLRDLIAMAGELTQLAENARGTRDDARQQAEWQAEALAGAETRLDRLEARAGDARRAIRDKIAARNDGGQQRLARKLQSSERNN